jgi:hypothetical protein
MGLLSEIFDPKPDCVKDITKKIQAYCVDLNSEVRAQIESDAIYYAENPKNLNGIEDGYANHKRDAEYYSLFFVYLACRDLLNSGCFHIYAGVASIEGNLVCEIGCDCISRLVQRGYINSTESENSIKKLRSLLTDIGIG